MASPGQPAPDNNSKGQQHGPCDTSPLPITSLVDEARTATAREHEMTLWQAIRLCPKAIGWSIVLSCAIVMEGYDNALIGSFYAFPAFQKKFGQLLPHHDGTGTAYELAASWQAALSGAMNAGQLMGLLLNGVLSERIGYKKTMLVALSAVVCLVPILFFAQNVRMLVVGELLLGVPLGIFQTLSVTYASEVCPVVLRGYLAAYVNLAWVMGQILALGILKGLIHNETEWSYRIPFTIQWGWPVVIIAAAMFAPESPWWQVRHGMVAEAEETVRRLVSNKDDSEEDAMSINVKETVSLMVHTNQIEMEMSSGITYLDCFRGTNFRRTCISCGTWAIQNMCGAGLGAGEKPSISWAIGSLLLVYVFAYNCSVGPMCYAAVSEQSSIRLRSKTVVLARALYLLVGVINSVIIPYMLNPTAWNWKGKAGLFWGSCCLLCVVWSYFCLPETKGRTYGELDVLFEEGTGARCFTNSTADPFKNGRDTSPADSALVASSPLSPGAVTHMAEK
ncbi:MFS maltose permease MalP [Bombardia bombarda]|uniref:MFS maltose permease MalP n=1 Tax=Bombardia bombarda TaxID=252184 RepID=A0AA39WBP5_9PEZI|nr:MFS maltose permease MalP [Bombardia bombarda]